MVTNLYFSSAISNTALAIPLFLLVFVWAAKGSSFAVPESLSS